jgi:hypothetical protein
MKLPCQNGVPWERLSSSPCKHGGDRLQHLRTGELGLLQMDCATLTSIQWQSFLLRHSDAKFSPYLSRECLAPRPRISKIPIHARASCQRIYELTCGRFTYTGSWHSNCNSCLEAMASCAALGGQRNCSSSFGCSLLPSEARVRANPSSAPP